MAKRVLGVLIWVVILGLMIPAFRLSNYISDNFEGALGFFLFIGLLITYFVTTGVAIFLLYFSARRFATRYGWNLEDEPEGGSRRGR